MKDNSPSNSPVSRRNVLKYGGLLAGAGAAGFAGVTLGSEPAIAATSGSPTISRGLVEGTQPISEFPIGYDGLSTSSPIKVSYTLTVNGVEQSTPAVQNTHRLPSRSGEITAGGGSITIPAGDIGLSVDVDHLDLSQTVRLSQNGSTTVPLDLSKFSGIKNYSLDRGNVTFSLSSMTHTDTRPGLTINQNGSTGRGADAKFYSIDRTIDLTGVSSLDIVTQINCDGEYDRLRVDVNGTKKFLADAHKSTSLSGEPKTRGQHKSFRETSLDVSGLSGDNTVQIGHRISGNRYRNPTSKVTDVVPR
jgi:hypothetical protein